MTIKMPKISRAIVKQELTDSSSEDISSNEEVKPAIVKVERVKNEPVVEHRGNDSAVDNDEGEENEDAENGIEEDLHVDNEEDDNKESNMESNVEDDEDSVNEADSDQENEDNADSDYLEDGDINSGWADSIAKILKINKPKKKKTLVLSKAKKINDVKSKAKPKTAGFQVKTADGQDAEAEIVSEEPKKEAEGPPRKKRKDILSVRVKPNILEKDRERLLSKIATKGVVQLFNAVKNQQKDIKSKLAQAGPLEVKRDKVLKSIDKRSFLDHLMGDNAKSIPVSDELSQKATDSNDKATWNVLRDDFMMGSNKMKDWDKQLEEDEMEVEQELESD